jgi:hypothetical protein
MKKIGLLFVSLVFMVLVSGIFKAGQTIDLHDLTIDKTTAGNGDPDNDGQEPFNNDLSGKYFEYWKKSYCFHY